ncbi:MAG TPA: hypothetical protein PLU58_05470 [Saprospiraceae bacterium]|nr:hypothetical protein [Saprospiraceae bacterium]
MSSYNICSSYSVCLVLKACHFKSYWDGNYKEKSQEEEPMKPNALCYGVAGGTVEDQNDRQVSQLSVLQ